jgi:acyl carrier protein
MASHEEPALLDDSWHALLLQLWRKFLKTENVSIDDDLFEKGGDSLLAIDMWLELQRLTGQKLPESILFEASTVRALAKRLSSAVGVRPAPVIRTV